MGSIKIVNLTEPIRSRNVVIRIVNYYGTGCLRLDVIGCHAGKFTFGVIMKYHHFTSIITTTLIIFTTLPLSSLPPLSL